MGRRRGSRPRGHRGSHLGFDTVIGPARRDSRRMLDSSSGRAPTCGAVLKEAPPTPCRQSNSASMPTAPAPKGDVHRRETRRHSAPNSQGEPAVVSRNCHPWVCSLHEPSGTHLDGNLESATERFEDRGPVRGYCAIRPRHVRGDDALTSACSSRTRPAARAPCPIPG